MNIINLREHPAYCQKAIAYFQRNWATEASLNMYDDAISRSLHAENPLPIWYLLMKNDEIVGGCGLITNDFISCVDLWPWLCALSIEPPYRGQSLGQLLIDECKKDAKKMGFSKLYLCTDLIGYYEKYGFLPIGIGYHPWGESSRVYAAQT